MGRKNPFDGLAEFLAIAKRQSIRKAALELEVTPGAISQALQKLERRLGTPLFHRTTRRISLTEAGEALLADIAPAALVIETSLNQASGASDEPSGTLKLLVERLAVPFVIEPILPDFCAAWPNVKVDITVSNRHHDFMAGGYDAGIIIGPYIAQDMIAVRLSPHFHWAVFGSPDYFHKHGRPMVPSDLAQHNCIRFRRPEKGDIYRWEFLENGQNISIEPTGPVTVDDGELMQRLAARGQGLIYSSTYHASHRVAAGQLEPVLLDYSPGTDGLFLYFTKTAQSQPKLRAFIDACSELRRASPD
ncbi:LysR family transcriptional regulator [Agrobacterium tumefaciens]|uniref:LysR family transcriptional regulator n=1 Tax=Agrobacterium tumefaciens TaxID=358 RepID=UPI00157177B4|nr:LysR family transcriptional regulator [Agrobacterium tumefaciens]NSY99658.1 LysR family transcriptional regulator [Agrobacterium tumefaciens]NSZ36411.1 LysR family transcriptional regulator [Agrobacterium tumefaciens]NTB21927.1 LysR family transcriptional regulator [Agrobacterium tumefaciens]NTB31727.1 LysR family transcriptional regulator [Agrobacterium tumefaciens]NTB32208.1 LysR family transcriptional regulator [Agrobacterium tumefaciens]